MKPTDAKTNIHSNSRKEINNKDRKFKIGDIVKILKYKNIFAKGYVPNRSEEVFVIKKVKSIVPWAYVISDFKDEEIVETFYEKKLQTINLKEFTVEKLIKRKSNKLYVKWKCYDNAFHNWINKKKKKKKKQYK